MSDEDHEGGHEVDGEQGREVDLDAGREHPEQPEPPERPEQPERSERTERPAVLLLRALGLGDFLTGVPAYRAVRAAYPDHEIVLAGVLLASGTYFLGFRGWPRRISAASRPTAGKKSACSPSSSGAATPWWPS